MAGKQVETIGQLFYDARSGGIDLTGGDFDPFTIEDYAINDDFCISLAFAGSKRVVFPESGNVSWGFYVEAPNHYGIKKEEYEGIVRQCNVGVLVARGQFSLLDAPRSAEDRTLRLTPYSVQEAYDPTASRV